MPIITGVSTAEEFIGAINDKGASLTNNSTPLDLVEAINATGGSVTFESTNEEVIEAVNASVMQIEKWSEEATGYDTLLIPKIITTDLESITDGELVLYNDDVEGACAISLCTECADTYKTLSIKSPKSSEGEPIVIIKYTYKEPSVYEILFDISYILVNGERVPMNEETSPQYEGLYIIKLPYTITNAATGCSGGVDEILPDYFYIEVKNA